MRRRRPILLLVLAALPVLACTSGEECDTCGSDSDCKDGLVCSGFSDGSKRCGTGTGATTCRT